MMKNLYLLLILVLVLTGCSFSQTAYEYVKENITSENDSFEQIEEVQIDSELEEVDEIVETVEEVISEEVFEPIVLVDDGAEIALEDVSKDFLGNTMHIFYNFTGKTFLKQGEDVLDWKAYVYITKNDLREFPYCTANQINPQEWVGTHCMEKKVFEDYGDNIKIIYTKRSLDDMRDLSYRNIDNLDSIFVFDPIIPK